MHIKWRLWLAIHTTIATGRLLGFAGPLVHVSLLVSNIGLLILTRSAPRIHVARGSHIERPGPRRTKKELGRCLSKPVGCNSLIRILGIQGWSDLSTNYL